MGRKRIVTKAKQKDNSAITKRILLITVCALVGIAVILGGVLGIITAVKQANALVRFDGVTMNEGEVKYLVSYYKAQYMTSLSKSGVAVSDTPEFWAKEVYNGSTYLDYLRISTESYLRQLCAANKIFEENATLNADDRDRIEVATDEILLYRAQGSKSTFFELCQKFGFDYSDFVSASEMIFKGWAAKAKIFGENGERMSLFPDYCDEYLNYYTHADLIFIRTEKVFVLDENGNKVKDEEGVYKMRALTDEEKAQRTSRIEELRRAVKGINEGTVTPERFYELQRMYSEGDAAMDKDGYYFYANSEYTKEFSQVFDEIVTAVYELEEGKCTEIACDIGTCFIRVIPSVDKAYTKTGAVADCFSDFYSLTADSVYQKLIEDYTDSVELRDIWSVVDLEKIPYNSDFVARF